MRRRFALRRPALLVLDVQNYFFREDSPVYLPASPAVLPRISDLVGLAIRRGWPIIATTHHGPSGVGNLMGEWWRHHPKGTECVMFSGLSLPPSSRHIEKQYYSAFFKTDLEDLLRVEQIDAVISCGVMTHLCVDTTARHAFMLGFKPIVVSDACCSKDPEYHAAALRALGHGFADIVTTRELLEDRL
jgi:bifunctional isochorismate lyase / aryl carrier protein